MSNDPISGDLITSAAEPSEMSQFNREEIDMQIATAKRYPRSIKEFRQEVQEMACLDEETAGSMFYALPRGGKKIEGPSARFAEVVGAAYGNLRYGARIAGIEGNFIVAEGVCFDTQKNISATVHVRRRITDSSGKRYNDDMIQVTGNAACSIALRNAIFKVVPMGLVKDVFEEAKKTSLGKAMSMKERRSKMLEWFGKAGITQDVVLESIGRAGVDDIDLDDLILLRGVVTAIKDGEVSVESAFDKVSEKRGVQRTQLPDDPPATKGKEQVSKAAAKKAEPEPKQVEGKSEAYHSYERRLLGSSSREALLDIAGEFDGDEALSPSEAKALGKLMNELMKG